MADSATQPSEPENQLSVLIYDISSEAQRMTENLLKMVSEINENSDLIEEEIEKCKDSALQRKKTLDEEKEQFQKAAYAVLEMLNRDD